MIDKKEMHLATGIAFVAFSTQFGAGFASGNMLIQCFVDYGAWAILMPLLSQGLLAFFFWYGLRYAYANKTFDYKSFNDSFYGRFSIVFSNLFEVLYLILIGTATTATFIVGGNIIESLIGIPYRICIAIIGLLVIVVAACGTDIVRKSAVVFSVLIIIGLLAVVLPNIIVRWSKIISNILLMMGGKMPFSSTRTDALAPALGRALLYFLFQLASVAVMFQHTKPCTSEKQIDRAAIYMFVLNTFSMILSVVGMCAVVYSKGLIDAETSKLIDVPMILFVEEGVGADILKPIISSLIVLGAVSTGINMISGIVTRCVNQVCKNENEYGIRRKVWSVIFAVIFTLFALAVVRTDIGTIIKFGYNWVGCFSFVIVGVPYIIHMFTHIGKKSF